jgi:hypothetical protein
MGSPTLAAYTASKAFSRIFTEAPEKVAQEGLDNIANGPLWIVSTKGNLERARRLAVVDGRAELVGSFAIPPRDQMADLQRRQLKSPGS